MAVAHHLLRNMPFGDSALFAGLLVVAFLFGSRVYGGSAALMHDVFVEALGARGGRP